MPNNSKSAIVQNLLSKKLILSEQYQELLKEAATTGKEVLDLIVEKKYISDDNIINAKGEVLNIPVVDLLDKQISGDVLNIVPEELARNYNLVPFEKNGNNVSIAMVDPENYQAVEALDFIARQKGLHLNYYLTTDYSLTHVIRQYANFTKEISEALENSDMLIDDTDIKEDDTQKLVKSAPVSKTVSVILRHAIEGEASDIHIEPMEKNTRVRYRVDGMLHNSLLLPINLHQAIVARIKVLSNLKIDETRLPQDGRFKIKFENRYVEFRVSTLPLLNKEKVVMRILDSSQSKITLESLGFSDRNLEIILDELKKPHGMLMVTGPTGSGKSTTLYAMLSIINKEQVNIVTLEDPVEYGIAGIAQAQIRPEVGLTFASGLRSILRQDPDVIMVGEVRDRETAELVVHAALTGHQVLSTLHTNDSIGAIPRLMDMKVESFLIASSLNVVIAQRLVRRLCEHCKQEVHVPIQEEEQILKELSDIPARSLPADIKLVSPLTFYKGMGCVHCENTGHKGRISIVEVLQANNEIKKIITENQIGEANVVKKAVLNQGMLSIRQDGILKAMRGLTTLEEVWNATKE